jgi:phosphatidylserine decarboxylase
MNALSMFTLRTLHEGKWPILGLGALTLATLLWCPVRWAVAAPAVLLAFVIWFFRDPERAVPQDPRSIVAPADGKIVEVKTTGDTTMVAIFLSVFDVHVQRAPVEGEIKSVRHNPGRFLDARDPRAAELNESRLLEIESADGFRVRLKQIAGRIARRIVGWAGEGARVAKGERIGMIRFGSRVELYMPATVKLAVKVGERARGGETVVATRS